MAQASSGPSPASDLWNLGKMVNTAVVRALSSGDLIKTSSVRERMRITQFDYGNEGAIGFQSTGVHEQEEALHWKDQSRFVEETLDASETKLITARLAKRFGTNEPQMRYWLSNFVHRVAFGQIDETALVERVALFLQELEGGKINYSVSAQLVGCWLGEDTQLTLQDGVTLR